MPTVSTLVHRSICVTPLVDNPHGTNEEIDGKTGSAARLRQTANNKRPIIRSISDAVVASRTRGCSDESDSGIHPRTVGEGQPKRVRQHPQISLSTPRPSTQRASSSSQTNLRSRYHDPDITSTPLRQELTAQTRPIGQRPPQASRIVASPSPGLKLENSEPIYIRQRSSSDPDLHRSAEQAGKQRLKPCMKKSKSTPSTPPGELQVQVDVEKKTLRRVKTVDFQAVASEAPPPVTEEMVRRSARQANSLVRHVGLMKKNQGKTACPGTTIKSSLADPAMTRTAVHVIAISPSWKLDEVPEDSQDPATPTMQIVESGSRRYEVIWDDVPAEHKVRLRQRRSSASHSLEAISSPATRGLQRVNTKLTDWSGSWNSPSDLFKPTIVVFPDDDGSHKPQYDCSVDDDEDLVVIAPPNSRMTSAGPSRLPSRPASAPMTRVASQEDIKLDHAAQEKLLQNVPDWTLPSEQLVVPDPDGSRLGSSRSLRQSGALRKLSNIEEADLKFRGHRDSVTIAHSRLLQSGGVSPELFARRDSVSMAKKRMHFRNHATPGARDFHRSDDVISPPLIMLEDDAASIVSLSEVKEHAAEALRNNALASILQAQQAPSQRHIRIVE